MLNVKIKMSTKEELFEIGEEIVKKYSEGIIDKLNEINEKRRKNQEKVLSVLKTTQDEIRAELKTTQEEIKAELNEFRENCEFRISSVKNEVDSLKKEFEDYKDSHITMVEKQGKSERDFIKLENTMNKFVKEKELLNIQIKKKSIIIHGFHRMKTDELNDKIESLFLDMETDVSMIDIQNLSWIYAQNKQIKQAKEASSKIIVTVTMKNEDQKRKIFSDVRNLKGKKKWHGISLFEDLSSEDYRKKNDAYHLSNFIRSKGKDCRPSGMSIILEGKKIKHEEFDKLPEDVNIENIKTRKLENGTAFAGEYSIYSNFYNCHIEKDGATYSSAEKLYQHEMANVVGNKRLASEIMMENDPYKIKALAKEIKVAETSKNKKDDVMREVLELKFSQNDKLKQDLINTKGFLFECTPDSYWGCGKNINKLDLNKPLYPASSNVNKLGQLLVELRQKLRK